MCLVVCDVRVLAANQHGANVGGGQASVGRAAGRPGVQSNRRRRGRDTAVARLAPVCRSYRCTCLRHRHRTRPVSQVYAGVEFKESVHFFRNCTVNACMMALLRII